MPCAAATPWAAAAAAAAAATAAATAATAQGDGAPAQVLYLSYEQTPTLALAPALT